MIFMSLIYILDTWSFRREVSEGIDQFKGEICFFFQNAEPL